MRRRELLKTMGFASLAGCGAGPGAPNIVLIMADDLGYSDIGCYGSEILTPNLNRLAGEGVRFTHFYNAARCCPTRASLMTGLYAHQAGVGHMWRTPNRYVASYRGYLSESCPTIPEVLQPAGYRTYMSGKWHLAGDRRKPGHYDRIPTRRGFERYYGTLGGAANYFRPGDLIFGDKPVESVDDNFYLTDAISDYAAGFVEEAAGDPYFLYVAYTAPHFPLHAVEEDIETYRNTYQMGWEALRELRYERILDQGLIDERWGVSPLDPAAPRWNSVTDKKEWALRMAIYAAQIDRMDQGIGRILEAIRLSGNEDNTLVMFLSDNGGCQETLRRSKPGAPLGSADSYESYGLPWANVSNTPFRLYKRWVHEGGIATPFIARWPSLIRNVGSVTNQPGHVIDLMATCADVAGAENVTPIEGKSLLPIFQGEQRPPHDALFFEHEGNRAVIRGKWKLASYVAKSPPYRWELYDLEADRTEMHDLSGDHANKVAELREAYESWAGRCGVLDREDLQGLIDERYLAERLG